jgi:hypothetical protein
MLPVLGYRVNKRSYKGQQRMSVMGDEIGRSTRLGHDESCLRGSYAFPQRDDVCTCRVEALGIVGIDSQVQVSR